MMTRKHFIALARALRESEASDLTINMVAHACKQDNPNFDRERFIAAARPNMLDTQRAPQ